MSATARGPRTPSGHFRILLTNKHPNPSAGLNVIKKNGKLMRNVLVSYRIASYSNGSPRTEQTLHIIRSAVSSSTLAAAAAGLDVAGEKTAVNPNAPAPTRSCANWRRELDSVVWRKTSTRSRGIVNCSGKQQARNGFGMLHAMMPRFYGCRHVRGRRCSCG